jgi:hypothetical protein
MKKKMLIQSLQFYYYTLIKKGFIGLRDNTGSLEHMVKVFQCRRFLQACAAKLNRLKDNLYVFSEFKKCLNRKIIFGKLKARILYKKMSGGDLYYTKIKRFRINRIKSTHRDFFQRIFDTVSFKRLVNYQQSFLRKKFYLKFFKTTCIIIANKCKQRKKLKDVDELYTINLIQKYINLWKKVTAASIEERSMYYRKLLVKRRFFNSLKDIYVRLYGFILVPGGC